MPKNDVTAKQIAEIVGVSPSTVSIVLNNKGDEYRISQETCEKIKKTAEDLDYRHVVQSKRKNKYNKLICAFCPTNFDRGPTARFYQNVKYYLSEQGSQHELILFPYEIGKLEEKAAWISGDFLAGAIMMGLGGSDIEFIEKNKFNIPLILFNRTAKGYCSVLTDDYSVGNKTMSHFVNRGHRRFGIVSPNYSSRALSLRTVGFWDRLNSYGFLPDEVFAAPVVYDDDSDMGGYRIMQKMLKGEKVPSALFLPSDNMVSGVVRCIHENGLSIPGDIEIISYGNKDINWIVTPSISSYVTPVKEIGYSCAQILYEHIENGVLMDNVKLSFEGECIFRESCPEK